MVEQSSSHAGGLGSTDTAGPDVYAAQVPDAARRYARAEDAVGMVGTQRRAVGSGESAQANRAWWNADAQDYLDAHGEFLGRTEFRWCPEGWCERDRRLLGEVFRRRILEVGCGEAGCARWLRSRGALAVGIDLSEGMLAHARKANHETGVAPALIQADAAALPFADGSFDAACSAFGALPFLPDLHSALTEVARVLRPGGRWVFAVTHPMRWMFPDVAGPQGLTVTGSYFDPLPYLEVDSAGKATYVEYHRTVGDFVRGIHTAGLELVDLNEPEWPAEAHRSWGQWTPERGARFPGTAIFCCRKPGGVDRCGCGPSGPSGRH